MKQSADLILGFDLLVAVSDRTLEVLIRVTHHTIIVASDSETPTGSMVGNPYASFPDAKQLIDRAAGLTNEESNFLVDAKFLCKELLGSSTSGQIFFCLELLPKLVFYRLLQNPSRKRYPLMEYQSRTRCF